ncbi:hypothetical protein [Carboxylicivirga taeanensis]|uniref:hypothetical protein n=1 Tax=Carboxylicivirga taeanensis TaxID=1416875 RepID=UPI003F6DD969
MKKMLTGLLAVILVSGCIGDEFDTDLIVDDVNTNAAVAIPLAKASVSMEDILSDQTDMVKYDGENIILFQETDSLEYVGINDFFRLSANNVSVTVPYILFNTQASVSQAVEFQMSIPNAEVREMVLDYQVSVSGVDLPAPLLLTITLPTANNGGTSRVIEMEVHSNQTATQVIAGDRFLIEGTSIAAEVAVKPLAGGSFSEGTIGTVSLALDELSLKYVRGTMSENQVSMNEGTYALDFDVLADIPGEVEFAEPQLSVIVDNATPFNGRIEAILSGQVQDGSILPLSSQPFDIEGVQAGEQSKRSAHILTNDNSNISSFLSKTPEQLKYAGILTLNPGNQYTDELELTDQDRIYIGYGFEVPLKLKLNAELEQEVIKLDDIDLLDDLTKAALVITSLNGLPIGASATIDFYDAQTASVLETMAINLVEPAKVNGEGLVIETSESTTEITLTESQVESLKKAEELRLSIRLNTSQYDEGQIVVFQRQNALDIQLGIRGKIEYNN